MEQRDLGSDLPKYKLLTPEKLQNGAKNRDNKILIQMVWNMFIDKLRSITGKNEGPIWRPRNDVRSEKK